MDKRKANPRKPPLEDLQGHSYQHELGDPDRAAQVERLAKKARKRTTGTSSAPKKKQPRN
jgi:hypothetical protein